MAALFACLLAVWVPAAGHAQSADGKPASIADILRALPPSGRVATLSTMLRTVGRSNPDGLARLFLKTPDVLPQTLSRSGGPEIDRLIWATFFAGALIDIGNERGVKPVVGYYNPLLEVWLITQWDAELPVPRVETAYLTTTDRLADPDAGFSGDQTVPNWVTGWRATGLIPTIQHQTARASRTFKRLFPPGGSDTRALVVPYAVARVTARTLATRAAILATGAEKALSTPAREDAGRRTLEAVRAGDAAALAEAAGGTASENVLIAEMLALPAETRIAMLVATAIISGERYVLLTPAAVTPRTIGLIEFRDGANGPVLTALAAFDAIGESPQ